MYGRIGGTIGGYCVECSLLENKVRGRLGGRVTGNNIALDISPDGNSLWGRIGGNIIGRDLNIIFSGEKASGRLGGSTIGDDIVLKGNKLITGRIGGPVIGFDCDLRVSPTYDKLTGRLGGTFIGADVNITLEDFPHLLAAVIAVTVYRLYLQRSQNNRAGK